MSIDKDVEGIPVAVTPSDVTVFNPKLDMIYVGVTGDVAYKEDSAGATFVLKNAQAGKTYRVRMAMVLFTATTATDIVGFL